MSRYYRVNFFSTQFSSQVFHPIIKRVQRQTGEHDCAYDYNFIVYPISFLSAILRRIKLPKQPSA